MENGYIESLIMDEIEENGKYMTTDEIAIALVKLYAEHTCCMNKGVHNEDYAEAVAIAIRMLTD